MQINTTTIHAAARAAHENAEAREGVRATDRVDFDDLARSEKLARLDDARAALIAAAGPSTGEWIPHPLIPDARVWEPAPGHNTDWAGNPIDDD